MSWRWPARAGADVAPTARRWTTGSSATAGHLRLDARVDTQATLPKRGCSTVSVLHSWCECTPARSNSHHVLLRSTAETSTSAITRASRLGLCSDPTRRSEDQPSTPFRAIVHGIQGHTVLDGRP